MHVNKDVRFVDDFLADELLDNILQSDDTKRALVLAGVVRAEHHVRLPLLEEVNDVQTRCVWASFGKGSQSEVAHTLAVLGIVCDENLDQQHANEVPWVVRGVNWDSRVALGQDNIHHLFVQNSIRAHCEDILHRRHNIANRLVLKVQNTADNCNLVFHESVSGSGAQSLVELHEGLQTRLVVHGAMILAE